MSATHSPSCASSKSSMPHSCRAAWTISICVSRMPERINLPQVTPTRAGIIDVMTSAVRFAQTRSADAVVSSIDPVQKLISSATKFNSAFSRAIAIAVSSVSQASMRAPVESLAAAIVMFLNRIEAETCCLVRAGAERHAGLDANHMTIDPVAEVGPRRRDYESTNLDRLPALLPLFQPITLGNLAHVHVAHR